MKRLPVLLLVVPLLAACGGSSTHATGTTTTAAPSVEARADAICRAYHATLAQYNQPETMPGIDVYYGVVQTALTKMVDRLAALRPRTAALDAYVAATRAELKPVAAIRVQARKDSVKGVRRVAVQGALLDKKAHALAVKAKLAACAETPASG